MIIFVKLHEIDYIIIVIKKNNELWRVFEVGEAIESLGEWLLVWVEEVEWGQIDGEGIVRGQPSKGSKKVAVKISKGEKWSWRGCEKVVTQDRLNHIPSWENDSRDKKERIDNYQWVSIKEPKRDDIDKESIGVKAIVRNSEVIWEISKRKIGHLNESLWNYREDKIQLSYITSFTTSFITGERVEDEIGIWFFYPWIEEREKCGGEMQYETSGRV